MPDSNCIFCSIIQKKSPSVIIFEDEDILAFNDLYPVAPIHILIIPKKHIKSMLELSQADTALMGKLLIVVNQIAKRLGLDGYKTLINTGESGGQKVFHIHAHLMANK